MARIGLLGGTFNPPHIGHLVCAQEAAVGLELDVVRLVVANVPPHKGVADDPGVEARLEMCRLAVRDDPRLEVSRVEADRPGPSFTVDTLRAMHAETPQDELTFVVGSDMALSLPTWREPEAVLGLARLGVAARDGVARELVLERLSEVPGAAERVDFFDMPRLDVSSTTLRRRAAAGGPIRYLVPEPVARFVADRGLYA